MRRERRKVKIDSLTPYPGNARRANLDLIRESLRELEQYRDIVVQESTGHILAGNNTWLAAQAEGWTEIEADFINVDDATARKINLVDNKANDDATYDNQALAKLLESLEGDYSATGFEAPDLDRLLDSLSTTIEKQDKIPPVPVQANTSPGDIIILGDHRLVCGSCLEPETLDLAMDGDAARLIVTSPPYNQQLDSFKPSGMQKENPAWVERMSQAYEDSMPEGEYQNEQVQLLHFMSGYATEDASFFYNHKIRYRDKVILSPMEWLADRDRPHPWSIRQEIVWDRTSSITLNAKMFMPCDERIYWLTHGDSFVFADTAEIKAYSSVWTIAPRVDVQVSAPFPIEIPRRCILACSERGDIVLDPYGGSGTTLIAAEETGRRAVLVEVNPAYCDVIVSRWESITGEKAVYE